MKVSLKDETQAKPLTKGEKDALVRLLSDPDPDVYRVIRSKLLGMGSEGRAWIKQGLESGDQVTRRHSRELLNYLDQQDADGRFLGFCMRNGESFDLETGIWLLTLTRYPQTDIDAYRAKLDSWAEAIRRGLKHDSNPPSVLIAINTHLFGELGFRGDNDNYYDPQNSYLNRVLERRLGNPISLCLIYLFIAKRLDLPVTGIGMPGHFLCRLQSSAFTIYVDVYREGNFLTHRECVEFLKKSGFGYDKEFLAPASSRRILLRVCSNLHQIYNKAGQKKGMERLQHYLVALAN